MACKRSADSNPLAPPGKTPSSRTGDYPRYVRTVRRSGRDRAADVLSTVPAERHEALLAYSRAVRAVDDARRELTLASAHARLRWHELDSIVWKLPIRGSLIQGTVSRHYFRAGV
jgi:hypothetical protein